MLYSTCFGICTVLSDVFLGPLLLLNYHNMIVPLSHRRHQTKRTARALNTNKASRYHTIRSLRFFAFALSFHFLAFFHFFGDSKRKDTKFEDGFLSSTFDFKLSISRGRVLGTFMLYVMLCFCEGFGGKEKNKRTQCKKKPHPSNDGEDRECVRRCIR